MISVNYIYLMCTPYFGFSFHFEFPKRATDGQMAGRTD